MMQEYQSHKIVEAAKPQKLWQDGNGYIHALVGATLVPAVEGREPPDEDGPGVHPAAEYFEGGEDIIIPANVTSPYTLDELKEGYVVRYGDGYVSWSPAKAFEDGYTAIT